MNSKEKRQIEGYRDGICVKKKILKQNKFNTSCAPQKNCVKNEDPQS